MSKHVEYVLEDKIVWVKNCFGEVLHDIQPSENAVKEMELCRKIFEAGYKTGLSIAISTQKKNKALEKEILDNINKNFDEEMNRL